MNLYTLNENMQKAASISKFNSVIWTERYSDAGDFSLVVPATPDLIALLGIDTPICEDNSPETMTIDTQSIEDNLLTVSGKSLVNEFGQRMFRGATSVGQFTTSDGGTAPISEVIQGLVNCLTNATIISEQGLHANEIFSNLTTQNLDPDVTDVAFTVTIEDMFSMVQGLASTYNKGITLQISSVSDSGFTMMFTVYAGVDRTSDQETYDLVRFSPDTKSFVGTTELYSNATYKNVCYAYASSMPATVSIDGVDTPINPRLGFAAYDDTLIGFARKAMMIDDTDFNIDNYGTITDLPTITAQIEADLDVYAMNALVNNTFTKSVDGSVVPQSQYKYGRDYFLGDVIELQGASGLIQNARVTEYIRSQDNTGETAYPTVAVTD